MFTGIIEELGQLRSRTDHAESGVVTLRAPRICAGLAHGDSVAVNGVCLTVVERTDDGFTADVMAATLERTTLGRLQPGDPVNLEQAVPADGRLGGHIVQGHIDATTTVVQRRAGDHWDVVTLALPPGLARYVAAQGSVALDGVSLTVSAVTQETFEVSLIPTTLAATSLGQRGPGEEVNLEVDVLAKYVERMLGQGAAT